MAPTDFEVPSTIGPPGPEFPSMKQLAGTVSNF